MKRDEPTAGAERRAGPLESIFQEAVRRTAAAGLSGFFMTEEAVRRAINDSVPKDWVQYVSRQGEEVRHELIDRLVGEFGDWLRTVDLSAILGKVLEDFEISARIELTPKSSGEPAASVRLVQRRK